MTRKHNVYEIREWEYTDSLPSRRGMCHELEASFWSGELMHKPTTSVVLPLHFCKMLLQRFIWSLVRK